MLRRTIALFALGIGFAFAPLLAACSSDDAPPADSPDAAGGDAPNDVATDAATLSDVVEAEAAPPKPVTCGTSTTPCNGCCKGNICIAVPNDNQCGKNGLSCTSCSITFQVCNASTGQCE